MLFIPGKNLPLLDGVGVPQQIVVLIGKMKNRLTLLYYIKVLNFKPESDICNCKQLNDPCTLAGIQKSA